jgi:ketosteroid isomerase-like protein
MTTATRTLIADVFVDLANGRAGALAQACWPDVQWWLPADPGWIAGPSAVDAALRSVLAGGTHIDSVVVSEAGTLAVVEQSVRLASGADTTPVTSVVRLRDERIISGLTYLDLAALGGSPRPDAR